ncbi:MAG: NYN domain-containing protein [Trueperaceae bacterium]|nr:NYN domain-containing protein [Trueperaceae bacterium]
MDWNSLTSSLQNTDIAAPESSKTTARKTTALFVDWESFKGQLYQRYGAAPDLGLLFKALEKYGERDVARAYGDWQNDLLQADGFKFHMRGIEPEQLSDIETARHTRPRSADTRIAAEAVDLCYTQPHLDTFVLVSSNAQLLYVADILKKQQRRVVWIALQGMPHQRLDEVANEVVIYDRDIDKHQPRSHAGSGERLEPAFRRTEDVLRRAKGKPVPVKSLYGALVKLYKFNPKVYGLSFNELLKKMQQAGRIKLSRGQKGIYAALPEGVKPPEDHSQLPDYAELPYEVTLVLEYLRGLSEPVPWSKVVADLKAKYGFKQTRDFRDKLMSARADGWLKITKPAGSDEPHIELGDKAD